MFLYSLFPQIKAELKMENQRLKDENGALIRVITKLSKWEGKQTGGKKKKGFKKSYFNLYPLNFWKHMSILWKDMYIGQQNVLNWALSTDCLERWKRCWFNTDFPSSCSHIRRHICPTVNAQCINLKCKLTKYFWIKANASLCVSYYCLYVSKLSSSKQYMKFCYWVDTFTKMDKILQVFPKKHCHGNSNIWPIPYTDHENGLWTIRDSGWWMRNIF